MKAPFNVSVIDPDEYIQRKSCLPVSSHSVYESSTQLFHPDGLFSEVIFGQIGSTERIIRRGYIDLHTKIINPHLYKQIIRLKSLYKDVLEGKKYAYFDNTIKDLVATSQDDTNGNTGYNFFLSVLPKIKFQKNDSIQRINRVEVVEKYRDRLLITKMIVLPAGVRDVKVKSGRVLSDEINKIYLSLLSLTKSLPDSGTEDSMYDAIRYQIQQKTILIYDYISTLMRGKNGFAQGKYTARAVVYANRNVITAAITSKTKSANSANIFSVDETQVPLYQAMKGSIPLVVYCLNKIFFEHTFDSQSTTTMLVNPVTKETAYYEISDSALRKYTTLDGIEEIIDDFRHTEKAFEPVTIELKEPVVINGAKYTELPLLMVYDDGDKITFAKSFSDFAASYLKTEQYKDEIANVSILANVDSESYIVEGSYALKAFGMDHNPADIDLICNQELFNRLSSIPNKKEDFLGFEVTIDNISIHVENKIFNIKNDDDFNKFKQNSSIKIGDHNYIAPAVLCDNYTNMTDENGKPVKRLKDEVKFEFFRTIVADINKFRPITMVELCYVATYMALRGKCCTVTRYPVLNIENLVPCKIHLMTTTPGRVVSLCTSVNDTAVVFPEYPVLGNIHSILKQSVSLHPTTLELLGADHDGDTISLNILMSDEATNEINKFLESKSSMLTSTGTLLYNLSTKWVIPISFLFATSHKLS